MKKFIKPEIILMSFHSENILTGNATAVKNATAAADSIAGSDKTFIISW